MSRTKSFGLALATMALLASAAVGAWRLLNRRIELPPPVAAAISNEPTFEDFLGAEACAECHAEQYSTWRGSTHGTAGGVPSRDNVIARFDGSPIRFADAIVIPSVSQTGQYQFTVRAAAKEPQVFVVTGVIGGGHMIGGGTQGFVSAFPDGTIRFLPFDFIRQENVWFCNTNSRSDRGWVPITRTMTLAECADWPPTRVLGTDQQFANCQECHGSQIQIRFDRGSKQYETSVKSLAINCESCHGPGREHVDRVGSGRATVDGDIGMRALATLSKDESLETCFQCHALKDIIEPGYLPGKELENHYSLAFPVLGDQPLFPDGRIRTFAYQGNHRYSDCYLNGSMTCVDCHDPHSQRYRDIWGGELNGRFDNGQCVDCHASKAAQIETHTYHAPESSGSRCVSCHMPYLQHPELGSQLRFARSDHSIPIPRPGADDDMGVRNACALCHADKSLGSLAAQVASWYGELKPRNELIEAQLRMERFTDARMAAAVLLDADAGHPMAQVAALGAFAERFLRPDMALLDEQVEDALVRLAQADDLDVRALALAMLHLARGEERGVRKFLARTVTEADQRHEPLRKRWMTALGTFGDRFFTGGDLQRAVRTYQKALEVQPDDPAVLLNLGLAQTYARNLPNAVTSFTRSLDAEPRQALAWTNLGLALEEQGDLAAAKTAYEKAIEVKPDEALAHFNLGNAFLRRDEFDSAASQYETAIEFDPNNEQAYIYLARAYVGQREPRRALAAARRWLQFAPQNPRAQQLVGQLEASLGVER